MKLTNEEANYSATVVKIHNLVDLEGADRLVGFPVFGMQAIVARGSYEVGQMGILFPTECQLSEDFAKQNNLYAHSELNENKEAKGYLGDNRRVRAIKLRGNRSTALFLPLSSLDYLGIDTNQLVEGESFTHIDGVEICKKYVVKPRMQGSGNKTRGQTKKFSRIDNKIFPEHWDTAQYFRNEHMYKDDDRVIVTQKLHGTSARFTNQIVRRKLTVREKIAKFFGVKVQEHEYDTLAGSRRVIKDIKVNEGHDHFYNLDLWNHWLEKIQHLIPKNWVLYGEIIGYVGEGSAIQKGYTYDLPDGANELYIYRITTVNEDGIAVDLSWDAIKEYCINSGLKHVPEMFDDRHYELDAEAYLNIKYMDNFFRGVVPLCEASPCDEGVCIRKEGLTPYVTKAKSPVFYEYETKELDAGTVDIESEESSDEQETEQVD